MSSESLIGLFVHFASLSLLAVGGALGLAPEMRRYLVDEHQLITGTAFTEAIVIAQAAPGPNILFVTLLGWQAGGAWGALATTLGLLGPSSLFTWWAARFKRQREDAAWVAAVRLGLSPIAIGLTAAAGWVVSEGNNGSDWRLWTMGLVAMLIVLRSRINMLWLILAGAVLGVLLEVG
jgi:chromate transporter